MRKTRYLWIANLPVKTTEEEVKDLFQCYGKVQSVKIHELCNIKGAIVAFMDIKSASKAFDNPNKFNGILLKLEYSDSTGAPGLQHLQEQISNDKVFADSSVQRPDDRVNKITSKQNHDFCLSPDRFNTGHAGVGSRSSSTSSNHSSGLTDTSQYRHTNHRSGQSTVSTIRVKGEKLKPIHGTHDENGHDVTSSAESSCCSGSKGGQRGLRITKLPPRSTDTSLREGLFHDYKKHGKITSVIIEGEEACRYAIITFKKPEDAEKAFDKSLNKVFYGHNIKVERHDGVEVEDPDLCPPEAPMNEFHPKSTKTLFVGNLDTELLKKIDLEAKFKEFGTILDVDLKMQTNQPGTSYAFIQYTDITSVVRALSKGEGMKIGDRVVKLGFGKTQPTNCLWLSHLIPTGTDQFIYKSFQRYGKIANVMIDSKQLRALVFFDNVDSAQKALTETKTRTIAGRKILIDYASRECQIYFVNYLCKTGQWKNYMNSLQSTQQIQMVRTLGEYYTNPNAKLWIDYIRAYQDRHYEVERSRRHYEQAQQQQVQYDDYDQQQLSQQQGGPCQLQQYPECSGREYSRLLSDAALREVITTPSSTVATGRQQPRRGAYYDDGISPSVLPVGSGAYLERKGGPQVGGTSGVAGFDCRKTDYYTGGAITQPLLCADSPYSTRSCSSQPRADHDVKSPISERKSRGYLTRGAQQQQQQQFHSSSYRTNNTNNDSSGSDFDAESMESSTHRAIRRSSVNSARSSVVAASTSTSLSNNKQQSSSTSSNKKHSASSSKSSSDIRLPSSFSTQQQHMTTRSLRPSTMNAAKQKSKARSTIAENIAKLRVKADNKAAKSSQAAALQQSQQSSDKRAVTSRLPSVINVLANGGLHVDEKSDKEKESLRALEKEKEFLLRQLNALNSSNNNEDHAVNATSENSMDDCSKSVKIRIGPSNHAAADVLQDNVASSSNITPKLELDNFLSHKETGSKKRKSGTVTSSDNLSVTESSTTEPVVNTNSTAEISAPKPIFIKLSPTNHCNLISADQNSSKQLIINSIHDENITKTTPVIDNAADISAKTGSGLILNLSSNKNETSENQQPNSITSNTNTTITTTTTLLVPPVRINCIMKCPVVSTRIATSSVTSITSINDCSSNTATSLHVSVPPCSSDVILVTTVNNTSLPSNFTTNAAAVITSTSCGDTLISTLELNNSLNNSDNNSASCRDPRLASQHYQAVVGTSQRRSSCNSNDPAPQTTDISIITSTTSVITTTPPKTEVQQNALSQELLAKFLQHISNSAAVSSNNVLNNNPKLLSPIITEEHKTSQNNNSTSLNEESAIDSQDDLSDPEHDTVMKESKNLEERIRQLDAKIVKTEQIRSSIVDYSKYKIKKRSDLTTTSLSNNMNSTSSCFSGSFAGTSFSSSMAISFNSTAIGNSNSSTMSNINNCFIPASSGVVSTPHYFDNGSSSYFSCKTTPQSIVNTSDFVKTMLSKTSVFEQDIKRLEKSAALLDTSSSVVGVGIAPNLHQQHHTPLSITIPPNISAISSQHQPHSAGHLLLPGVVRASEHNMRLDGLFSAPHSTVSPSSSLLLNNNKSSYLLPNDVNSASSDIRPISASIFDYHSSSSDFSYARSNSCSTAPLISGGTNYSTGTSNLLLSGNTNIRNNTADFKLQDPPVKSILKKESNIFSTFVCTTSNNIATTSFSTMSTVPSMVLTINKSCTTTTSCNVTKLESSSAVDIKKKHNLDIPTSGNNLVNCHKRKFSPIDILDSSTKVHKLAKTDTDLFQPDSFLFSTSNDDKYSNKIHSSNKQKKDSNSDSLDLEKKTKKIKKGGN